ncbi:MAG: alpha/beta hydrolase-fold protein [Myxococcota bacterium]|nr:alpha/beta hydrolase-fold protein [Myxococcota bacterium]
METLACEVLGPDDATQVVIWLHGLGASGHDFVPIVPMLKRPQTRFVFPHAPQIPVTINMGHVMPAWYDILHMGDGPNREPDGQVLQSTQRIHDLIHAERQRGVATDQMIIAGFSQGGALALHAGVRYPEPLAGIMVLSAYELRVTARASEMHPANASTPMLFCHGSMDQVVPVDRGRRAFNAYHQGARTCRWQEYPMGHEVCGPEVDLIRTWFDGCLDG